MSLLHEGVWRVPCRVVKVLDADTIRVDADLGWGVWKKDLDVRIDGLWSPENSTPEGKAATGWAKTVLPVGLPVTLHSRWVLTFSRVVGSLYLADVAGLPLDYAAVCIDAGHGVRR